MATIHSYNKAWKNATIHCVMDAPEVYKSTQEVINTEWQGVYHQRQMWLVTHPDFDGSMYFFNDPDEDGKCHNVGNAAYWITPD